MAKKKRKKVVKEKYQFSGQLWGIVLILIAVLGIGKLGIVGRFIASFGLFVTGSVYMVFLAAILLIGIYFLFTKKSPDFFSTKLIGVYIFCLGILTLMHKDFVIQNNGNVALIFKETINQLVLGFNGIMNNGLLEDWFSVGGGIIGGAFSCLFVKLFSYKGMLIVSGVFIATGFGLFTGFSILDWVKNRVDDSKEALSNRKERAKEKASSKEETGRKGLIINGGSNLEEEEHNDKIKISSIEELTKVPEKEDVREEVIENTPKVVEEKNIVNKNYKLPGFDLLDKPKGNKKSMDEAAIEHNVAILEKVLEDFHIVGKVVEVHIGPSVAQYELEIASGTRVNKITGINREIALALAKKDVRIEAPIPGKNTVGIEFANDISTPVSFYEIMASKKMLNTFNDKLTVPLGKNIMGDVEICAINKMPHLLIAGTTGSGKSVCVNGIICSILMKARPEEVKMVLVDPKMVELSVYNGVPHLLCPVVVDPKKAAVALGKMVAEMERRYEIFSETATKSIESYNNYVDKENKGRSEEDKMDRMPYIVVIIDELSDLMMVAAKDVEDSILRITQKARAAGIHLIVATQRPSTEVITGLIKANIPSRISFAVGSGIDSRTILDQTGAEKLLGKGDMLYLPIGVNSPTRIQGSFITDDEIKRLIDFTIKQQKAQYSEELLNLEAVDNKNNNSTAGTDDGTVSTDGMSEDEEYKKILDFVVRTQKASASLLQRKFQIGYNKAARMIDRLEEDGVIGPATGNSKPREVLVQLDSTNEE